MKPATQMGFLLFAALILNAACKPSANRDSIPLPVSTQDSSETSKSHRVVERIRASLKMERESSPLKETEKYKHRMVKALESADEASLANPTIVNVWIIARTNEIVVDYICNDAVANSLILHLKDGSTCSVPIPKFIVEMDREMAEEFVTFSAVANLKNTPAGNTTKKIRGISLAIDDLPVTSESQVDFRDDL